MAHFSFLAARTQLCFMKYILYASSFFLFLVASAFRSEPGLDDVIKALQKGSASELSKYIDDNIEITLPDKSDNYSRTQAVMILQDFFNNNGVITFEVIHSGDNAGAQYVIGNLQTKKGTYRTTIYIKQKADKQVLQEIRFEK